MQPRRDLRQPRPREELLLLRRLPVEQRGERVEIDTGPPAGNGHQEAALLHVHEGAGQHLRGQPLREHGDRIARPTSEECHDCLRS